MTRRFDVVLHPLPASGYRDDEALLQEAEWMLAMLFHAYVFGNRRDRTQIIGRVEEFLPHLQSRVSGGVGGGK